MNSVCIAVLNYNGVHHLEHLLPSLEAACSQSPVPASVVVLDNRSTGPDVEWMRRNSYSHVNCIVAPRNDYLFSYNWLLSKLEDDVVVILNNDVRVSEDFLAPLLRHMAHPDVFAVSARSYDWGGQEVTSGPAELIFRNGFYGWSMDPRKQTTCHTLFNSGACMAVDRNKFLQLGGFNRLFYPAYCEDLELGFRAWRHGWRCIYEPSSVFWHREHASWSASKNARPNQLNLRNSILFQAAFLPMDHQRLKRWWSVCKLVLGDALRGKADWLDALIRTVILLARQSGEKSPGRVSREELARILGRIRQEVPNAGRGIHLSSHQSRSV